MTLAILFQYLLTFPILALSLSCHEFAHGWVAYRCGDDTAKQAGRLTLNPLAHIDLWGTVLLPIFFILIGFFLSILGGNYLGCRANYFTAACL